MKKIGLTLGKYSPLHKGHEHVIKTALKEMDHLVLMIYDSPETTVIPLSVRANWIRSLYPEVEVIEAWDGPVEVGYTPEIMAMHDAYITHMMKGKGITHFYSSEEYGKHVSLALGAENRTVDIDRTEVPISGSDIRQEPYKARSFLSDIVYRDHIINAVFLGAPSTGKTTLSRYMAEIYNTEWMPEYGREYWEENHTNRRLTPQQLVEIAQGHIEREEKLLQRCKRILFTDTNALTTRIFAHYYHGKSLKTLDEIANTNSSRYDIFFLCDIDIPYDDTWDRSGEVNRLVFQKQIIADLHQRRIPFIVLSGTLNTRAEKVQQVLSGFRKYSNFYGTILGNFR